MNKDEVTIGSTSDIKINTKNWSKQQIDRADELCKRLKPAYEKIKAGNICNGKCVDKVLAMSKDIAFINIRHHERWNEYKALKPFNTHLKNQILHYVVYSSAVGDTMYKEKLAKKLNSSHKTIQKSIDDLVDGGSLIIMATHSESKKAMDDRIVNLRPSVEVTVAYIDYNIRAIINDLKFAAVWTKIKLSYEFDYNERAVV